MSMSEKYRTLSQFVDPIQGRAEVIVGATSANADERWRDLGSEDVFNFAEAVARENGLGGTIRFSTVNPTISPISSDGRLLREVRDPGEVADYGVQIVMLSR